MHTLALLSLVAVASACASMMPQTATQYARYESALVEVARPRATKERWGAVDTISVDSGRFVYEDSLLHIAIVAGNASVPFAIRNKTEHSIRLIWDEASFIGVDGKLSRVMHEGVRFADRNTSQPPSIIPAKQTFQDAAWPNDRVYFQEGFYGQYYSRPAEWKHLPLLLPEMHQQEVRPGAFAVRDQVFASQVGANRGKRFALVLPLQIEGVTNEYTFWFEVRSAEIVDGLGFPPKQP